MKSFDPDFRLRAYFQVKYGDVINARASKLIPYLSIHDSYHNEESETDELSWSNPIPLLEPVEEEQLIDSSTRWYYHSSHTHAPRSSTISTHADSNSDTPSLVHTTSSTESSSQNKRSRVSPNDEDAENKRQKVTSLHKTVRFASEAEHNERSTLPEWNKSLIFRLQPSSVSVVQDPRYTFVKLPAPDVESCAAVICTKMGIPYFRGMRISWVDSETSLRGPFDHAFLWTVADMQDFLIDIIDPGVSGKVELLLVM